MWTARGGGLVCAPLVCCFKSEKLQVWGLEAAKLVSWLVHRIWFSRSLLAVVQGHLRPCPCDLFHDCWFRLSLQQGGSYVFQKQVWQVDTNQAENSTFYENLASKVMQHYFPLVVLVKVVRIPPRFRRKGSRLHLLLERDILEISYEVLPEPIVGNTVCSHWLHLQSRITLHEAAWKLRYKFMLKLISGTATVWRVATTSSTSGATEK